jgi:hypothetical protein
VSGDARGRVPLEALDDETIARLVHDAADGWTMPPVRLDAPSWRDRIRGPRARQAEAAGRWFARLGQAATAAIALSVAGALAAVLISRGPVDPGSSANPTGNAATPDASAAFTPLPQLLLEGQLPAPSRVLVRTERGDFALVDLATGRSGGNLTGAVYGSSVQARADGSILCLCVRVSGSVNGSPTHAEISIDRFDRDGRHTSTTAVATLQGEADPRDGALPERPPHLAFTTGFSEGGRYGLIGWSVRAHPVWRSGVIVVDLAEEREVGRLDLPDSTTGEGDTRRVVFAPQVVGSAGAGRLALARESYEWSPPEAVGGDVRPALELFRADFAGGALSNLASVDASGCGQRVLRAGVTADDRWWVACQRFASGEVVVRRFDGAGGRLGETIAAAGLGVDGDVTAVAPGGGALFIWDAVAGVLTRVDLETGATAQGRASAVRVDPGPLAAVGAVGEWLAPPVAAKTFLDAGIVLSPDGRRAYAVGLAAEGSAAPFAGSSGILVFDTASLERLDRWDPTAAFVSLAVSADGGSVYAAGLPGLDAAGTSRPAQHASITVFSATDGSVRLIAGRLGTELLTFTARTLD